MKPLPPGWWIAPLAVLGLGLWALALKGVWCLL